MRSRLLLLGVCLLGVLTLGSCSMPSHADQVKANEAYLAQEGITALKVGAAAPALDGAMDLQGAPASLPELLAQHQLGTIVFFIPALDTPNSERNLREWQQRSTKLTEQGLGVYAVAPASSELATTWLGTTGLDQVHLLADPLGQTARAWGCLGASGKYPQRTAVGVRSDGTLALFYRGMPTPQDIERAFGLKDAK